MSLALAAILAVAAFPQDGELTPASTLRLLREAHRLMKSAEERLNESRPGEAEPHERGAAGRLAELIRKARATGGRSSADPRRDVDSRRDVRPPGSTKRPSDPDRFEEPSRFKSRGDSGSWGRLPPGVRGILLQAVREEMPPEFQEPWRKYSRALEESGRHGR
jgi:hypothetical protein